jgi:hypothetical protein
MQIIKSASRPGLLEGNVPGRSVNASQLERWLGKDEIERVSVAMKDWYGPPIAMAGVPGKVFAHRGGDFRGELRAGYETSAKDRFFEILKKCKRASRKMSRRNGSTMHAGFASFSDLIAEVTQNNKRYDFVFSKSGSTGVVNATNTLWFNGGQPAAGAAAAAAPGGTVPTDATTGAFPFTNPTGGDTMHFINAALTASVINNTLLLYDRIFSVTKTMNSTATEAVTGVPTRYQGNTPGTADYAGGNFLMIECRTALAATAHNWTTCTYVDQDGNTGATLPSVTGNASNIINRLDQPVGQWFCPLATGDIGIDSLTQMQCSAAVATGAIDFTIGHPIAFMPCPVANSVCGVDGLNSAFNLVRIFDDACLAFLEIVKPATTATNYTGMFTTAYG